MAILAKLFQWVSQFLLLPLLTSFIQNMVEAYKKRQEEARIRKEAETENKRLREELEAAKTAKEREDAARNIINRF